MKDIRILEEKNEVYLSLSDLLKVLKTSKRSVGELYNRLNRGLVAYEKNKPKLRP